MDRQVCLDKMVVIRSLTVSKQVQYHSEDRAEVKVNPVLMGQGGVVMGINWRLESLKGKEDKQLLVHKFTWVRLACSSRIMGEMHSPSH